MIRRYDQIDAGLKHLIEILLTPRDTGEVYVPMPSTVRLLRRANALCARNMLRCDFQVEHPGEAGPIIKSKRPTGGHRG